MKKSIFKNENLRKALHILSGIIAALSFVAFVLLLLVKFNFLPLKNGDNNTSTTLPQSSSIYETTKKNYVIFIDERYLYHSETNGVTTIRGKTDRNIKMKISPLLGTSYPALCNETQAGAELVDNPPVLNTYNLYTAYTSTTDGLTTLIYCIDDGVGSSVKIECTYPEENTQAKETFEIMLSMFKLTIDSY